MAERLAPLVVDVQDAGTLLNVNAPEDLLTASALLAERERVGRDA